MDNYEFNLLPLNDKSAYTQQHGSYLAAREFKEHTINLYHVDKFFDEVWYNPTSNCIDNVKSFKSQNCLQPYLEKLFLNI